MTMIRIFLGFFLYFFKRASIEHLRLRSTYFSSFFGSMDASRGIFYKKNLLKRYHARIKNQAIRKTRAVWRLVLLTFSYLYASGFKRERVSAIKIASSKSSS